METIDEFLERVSQLETINPAKGQQSKSGRTSREKVGDNRVRDGAPKNRVVLFTPTCRRVGALFSFTETNSASFLGVSD